MAKSIKKNNLINKKQEKSNSHLEGQKKKKKKKEEKNERTVNAFLKSHSFSKQKTNEVLPLLYILRDMPISFRIIIMSHLNDESRDHLKKVLRNVLLDKTDLEELYQEDVTNELENYVDDVCSVLNSPFKKPKCKQDCLLKIAGAPFQPVLNYAIPLMLRMSK